MEPTKVIQNIDSLWLFCNPLLSKYHLSSPLSSNNNHNTTITTPTTTKKLNPLQSSPTLKPLTPKTATTTCQIHQSNPPSSTEISPRKATSSKRKPRTKKSSLYRQHFIKRTKVVEGSCKIDNNNGYGNVVEMPSCSDDEAMKKHLRTWAVAVAYKAVRNTNSFMVVACS